MNIFRPAYFTPRHWREGGGVDIAVWANSRVERKHWMWQEREDEGDGGAPAVSVFHLIP